MIYRLKNILCGPIALGLILVAATPVLAAGTPIFSDVQPGYWAAPYIERAYNVGAVKGTSDDGTTRTYNPDGLLDMFQWVTILTNAYYADEIAALPDGKSYYGNYYWTSDHWYAKNMHIGEIHGLLTGLESYDERDLPLYLGLGHPDFMGRPTIRFEMAQMSYNLLKDLKVDLPPVSVALAAAQSIPDWQYVPELYQEAVAMLTHLGVITGIDAYGTFSGYDTFTRAQAAVVFCRLDDVVNGVTLDKPALLPAPAPGTPIAPADLNGDGVITESEVITKMIQLEEIYPYGGWYENETPYFSKAMPDYIGLDCGKLGLIMTDSLFGDLPYREHHDYTKIRPGDTIILPGHMETALSHSWQDEDGFISYTKVSGTVGGAIGWWINQFHPDNEEFITIRTRYPIGQ